MKVLWLCNIILPVIARQLNLEVSNKEGWLSGLAETLLEKQHENGIELSVAFPMQGEEFPEGQEIAALRCYGFPEDVGHPEKYDKNLELVLKKIVDKVKPDLVHCFGTEYPHTLAMCRIFPDKDRLLVGVQGLCSLLAEAYFADLPEWAVHNVTLRDWLKRDSIRQQQKKFALRGRMERESVSLAGNVTGRTKWDRENVEKWNSHAGYYHMDETMRPEFYGPVWQEENCIPHSIFLSQADYPVKGFHYMLRALPAILDRYPDAQVYVAGNSLVGYGTLKQKLKISAYGSYLRKLLRNGGLEGKVTFLGMMNAGQMRDRYLKSSLFVCPSSLENSPNSLGEAMLLGMPCVCAAVGGIPSLFRGGEDGILYRGFRAPGGPAATEGGILDGEFRLHEKVTAGRAEQAAAGKGISCGETGTREEAAAGQAGQGTAGSGEGELERIAGNLANAVIEMWDNPERQRIYCRNAKKHAEHTHNREKNYARLIEIYEALAAGKKERQAGQGHSIRVAFVSNYINHHQIPFCNAMYRLLEGAFYFIQTEPMEAERVQMGWHESEKPAYVHCFYEEEPYCRQLILDCDMVLFGGTDEESYIAPRLASGRPLMRYSERLYKTGQWKAVSPRGLMKKYRDHTRYRKSPVYLLCAGAYVPSDFHIVRAYPGKMYCWGYFPETRHYDLDRLLKEKGYGEPGIPYLLWAARMIDWKHPELALETAAYLKRRNLDFHMDIIGDGEMRPEMEELAKTYRVEDYVTFLGYQPPEEVRSRMERADIFLFTSDRREGWGAVANEAMNSACALVADHMIGAVPSLVRPGVNGLVYEDGKKRQLFYLTERLVTDRIYCRQLGRNAYGTITETWNAENAAGQLLKQIRYLLGTEDGEGIPERDGQTPAEIGFCTPCAPAPILSERRARKRFRNLQAPFKTFAKQNV